MRGVPFVNHLGMTHKYNYMSMRPLGPSISDLMTFCGGRLSIKSTLMIGLQLVDRLQDLHANKIVH